MHIKHIKKLNDNDFEKKSKIAKKLEIIAFWVKLLFLAPAIGILIFFLTSVFGNTSVSIFFGIVAAYYYLVMKILMHSSGKKLRIFLRVNAYLALLIIIAAILLLLTSQAKELGIFMLIFGFQILVLLFMIGLDPDQLDKYDNQVLPTL